MAGGAGGVCDGTSRQGEATTQASPTCHRRSREPYRAESHGRLHDAGSHVERQQCINLRWTFNSNRHMWLAVCCCIAEIGWRHGIDSLTLIKNQGGHIGGLYANHQPAPCSHLSAADCSGHKPHPRALWSQAVDGERASSTCLWSSTSTHAPSLCQCRRYVCND